MIEPPPWTGRTVVCIASGPSLTAGDCELVRASGHPVVVTNTTYRMCPWADVLFAFDARWWRLHADEVAATFPGRKFTASRVAANYGAEFIAGTNWFSPFRNSGACAVTVAIGAGAAKVVMLGFDCGFDGTRRHWHEDHPGMANCDTIGDWPRQFGMLAKVARRRGIEIVNASRHTRLECFARAALEDVL